MTETTQFGAKRVPLAAKQALVNDVFHSVARRYDLMNDLMSFGLHRAWKDALVTAVNPPRAAPFAVLDIAGGTGDLAQAFARKVGQSGQVVHTDINEAMLREGRDRLIDSGVVLPSLVCDAEKLPFASGRFDLVSVAFGLRNMTRKDAALAEMNRVLRPGGKLLVLEFSRVAQPLSRAYDWYSFQVLPRLAAAAVAVHGRSSSCRYRIPCRAHSAKASTPAPASAKAPR